MEYSTIVFDGLIYFNKVLNIYTVYIHFYTMYVFVSNAVKM